MTALILGIMLLAAGVFLSPIDQLPNDQRTTLRAFGGATLLLAAGVSFGHVFFMGAA